ncbi:hypothetical protein ACNKHS_23075 [Shigella flexneri]
MVVPSRWGAGFQEWCEAIRANVTVSVALVADTATILGAVTPFPDARLNMPSLGCSQHQNRSGEVHLQ